MRVKGSDMDIDKQQLVKDAERKLILAYAHSRAHSRLASLAFKRYGDQGSLISGIVRDHFPRPMKNSLRAIARKVGKLLDESLYDWRLAGKQRHTWIRLKDATIAKYGKGYYG
jgi:hypothetical protein